MWSLFSSSVLVAGRPALLGVFIVFGHLVGLDDVLINHDFSNTIEEALVVVSVVVELVIASSCSIGMATLRSRSPNMNNLFLFLIWLLRLLIAIYLITINHVVHIYVWINNISLPLMTSTSSITSPSFNDALGIWVSFIPNRLQVHLLFLFVSNVNIFVILVIAVFVFILLVGATFSALSVVSVTRTSTIISFLLVSEYVIWVGLFLRRVRCWILEHNFFLNVVDVLLAGSHPLDQRMILLFHIFQLLLHLITLECKLFDILISFPFHLLGLLSFFLIRIYSLFQFLRFGFKSSVLVMNIIYLFDMSFAFIFEFFNQFLDFLLVIFQPVFHWVFVVLEFLQLVLKSLHLHFLFLALQVNGFNLTHLFVVHNIFLGLHFVQFMLHLHIVSLIIIDNPVLIKNVLFIFFVLLNA